MATTTNITTSYAGEGAMPYVAAALFSSPTLEQGGVEIVPNIKFRKTLRPASMATLSEMRLVIFLHLLVLLYSKEF